MIEYQIWSRANAPMMTFDNLSRAQAELDRCKVRGIQTARIVKVTRIVEEMPDG